MVAKYGNNIYTFYTRRCCNNSHASEICNKFDGILTHIKSSSIQEFIKERIENNGGGNYWIGLYQISDDKRNGNGLIKKKFITETGGLVSQVTKMKNVQKLESFGQD